MADCSKIPTLEQIEEYLRNILTIREFIQSNETTLIDQYGVEHQTLQGIQNVNLDNINPLLDFLNSNAETVFNNNSDVIKTLAQIERELQQIEIEIEKFLHIYTTTNSGTTNIENGFVYSFFYITQKIDEFQRDLTNLNNEIPQIGDLSFTYSPTVGQNKLRCDGTTVHQKSDYSVFWQWVEDNHASLIITPPDTTPGRFIDLGDAFRMPFLNTVVGGTSVGNIENYDHGNDDATTNVTSHTTAFIDMYVGNQS